MKTFPPDKRMGSPPPSPHMLVFVSTTKARSVPWFLLGFFLLKNVQVGERATSRSERPRGRARQRQGPSAPQRGWGLPWGPLSLPPVTVGQSRGWRVRREGNGGQAAGEGGTRGAADLGGRKQGPRRGKLQGPGGPEPRAGERAASALPPSCLYPTYR